MEISPMGYANSDALVSTSWLEEHLSSPEVSIVDATYYLPNDERNAAENYSLRHIPGAVFFNIDAICDSTVDLPHMLPSPEKFSLLVRKLGLGDGNRIVVYDSSGGFMAACRVWWMFRMFGHLDVAVLDGGLPKWDHEKRPVSNDKFSSQKQHFSAKTNNKLVKNISQMLENVERKKFQVIDARTPGRFSGDDPEPRPTEKVGHIPGSINVPFPVMLNPRKHFTFKSADEIKAVFEEVGIDINKPIAASCGSGVTAAVITFALYLIGNDEGAVYDGSWAEWGDHPDTQVVS
jgi:thiosulfate/3-mercaptopyruvate sulfurtransferase